MNGPPGIGVQGDDSLAGVRFASADGQGPLDEINVSPSQSPKFTAAHRCVEGEDHGQSSDLPFRSRSGDL
jgi:hypothetical protein